MNIAQLKEKLSAIKQRGYVVSLRRGNTGIGYTLETLLELDENNLRTPDLGDIELKSQRNGVSNRVTMFTFNRGVFQDKLIRNQAGLEAYLGERKDVEIFVSSKNTANRELPENQPPNGFDLILTSPPYGDSQTTVAYGQFSRLSADWIGLPTIHGRLTAYRWAGVRKRGGCLIRPLILQSQRSVLWIRNGRARWRRSISIWRIASVRLPRCSRRIRRSAMLWGIAG